MVSPSRWYLVAWAIAVILLPGLAVAYDVVEVGNGGAIVGKITATGALPVNKIMAITKDTDHCGSSIEQDYLVVDAGGGLKNAVVMLKGVSSGKSFDKKKVIRFDNVKCMYSPHVAVAVKGQLLGINNSDPILHNTHLYQGVRKRTLYNIALPLQDVVVKKLLRRSGNVTVKCDAHEWMLGYVYVSDNPYITVTDSDGSFALGDVPPGTYSVHIWHELLGEMMSEITVEAGQEVRLDKGFSVAG